MNYNPNIFARKIFGLGWRLKWLEERCKQHKILNQPFHPKQQEKKFGENVLQMG